MAIEESTTVYSDATGKVVENWYRVGVVFDNAIWVVDLDLSPLGESPAAFARNTRLLRLERPDLDDAAWRRCLHAFLARLYAAPRLYSTPAVEAAFGARAKANVARALLGLQAA